jgi:hypothetical protein
VLNKVKIYGYEVKYLMTDDDALYRDAKVKKMLAEEKISKRTSVPYKHSSNGFIERTMRTIIDKARTIMLVYNCPLKFWPEAIDTAVYLFNVTPMRVLGWETPYQRIFKKVPDISNLKPFYSPGLVYLSKDERNHALSKKALECRLLGYDKEAKNGYIVWVPELQRVKRTINVRFKEDVDLTKDIEEDDLRNISRFKDLTIEGDGESLKDIEDFFDKADAEELEVEENEEENDLYQKEENIISNENEVSNALHEDIKLPPVPRNVVEAYDSENAKEWIEAIDNELKQSL